MDKKGTKMVDQDSNETHDDEPIIREIIALERSYYFEKRQVRTERQRKLREIIERNTKVEEDS